MKAKTLKKGLGIALSMAMTMSLFGCGSGDSAKEQASDTSETTEVAENTDSKDSDTDKGGIWKYSYGRKFQLQCI